MPFLGYSLLMFATASTLVALAAFALRWRRADGVAAFALALLAGAWWTVAALGEELAGSRAAAYFWLRLKYLGIIAIPVLWLVFTLRYTRKGRRLGSRLHLLWVLPVVTLLVVWSNDLHGGMWTVHDVGPGGTGVVHGPWFWVHGAYGHLLLAVALVVLLWDLVDLPRRFRQQAALLLVATGLPAFVNAAHLSGWTNLDFDPTPVSFAVSAGMAAWALFRLGLFQLVPTAYRTVFRSLPDAVVVVDDRDCIIAANPAAAETFRLDLDAAHGCLAADTIPAWNELSAVAGERRVEVEVPDGDPQYLEVRLTPLRGPRGDEMGRVLVARNISKLRFLEQHADLDPLTGLPNRRRFAEEAVHILGIAAREGWCEALLYIDLDRFKRINDRHGHAVGDQVLHEAARRMLEVVRQGDLLARFGGDEFVMLLNDADEDEGREVAQRLIERVLEPFRAGPLRLDVGASVGVALYPRDSGTLSDLISLADAAMYRAKRRGGGVHVHGPEPPPDEPGG